MKSSVLARVPVAHARIATAVGLGLVVTVGRLAFAVSLALMLAPALAGETPDVLRWAAVAAAASAVCVLATWLGEAQAEAAAHAVGVALRRAGFQHLLDLGPGRLSQARTGELQTTLVAGVASLETFASRFLPSAWLAALGPFLVIGLFLALDVKLGLALLAVVIAAPAVNLGWLAWRMPKSGWIFASISAFTAHLVDGLQGIATLKAFGAAGRWRDGLATRARDLRQASMANLTISLMRDGITTIVSLGGIAAIVVWSAWRTTTGDLAPATALIALFAAREAVAPLERLEKAFHAGFAGATAMKSMAAFLQPSEAGPAVPVAEVRPPTRFDIAFDRVRFAYEPEGRAALDGVTLMIGAGKTVALVGPSGAGKSTFAAMLLGFVRPDAGTVHIGGIDIARLSAEDLRACVGHVAQDTFLFSGTIAENLRLARPEASDADLVAAAKAAHAHEFISALPGGYASEVGERGTALSGGQRQRIAIARALLKDAPILILDEPTSNLDPESEAVVHAALARVMAGRTVLIIAHKLSTVSRADQIFVLDGGRLVESGRPQDLAERGGAYARLRQAQGAH